MSPHPPTLVWLRHDLRIADQPALAAASTRGPVIPVFIWSPEEEKEFAPGGASRWWLHHSLASLDRDFRSHRLRLILRRGPSLATLQRLVKETGATRVFWGRRYEPAAIARDKTIKEDLRHAGIEAESFNTSLLVEPWDVKTQTGNPYQVFTPFWKAAQGQLTPAPPQHVIPHFDAPTSWPASEDLRSWKLLPTLSWADGFTQEWEPGEAGAWKALTRFLEEACADYSQGRDRPAQRGTSRLSPHLHFGEIHPKAVWEHVVSLSLSRAQAGGIQGAETYTRELGWREFAYHLLYHFPKTPSEPLRPAFNAFPWRSDAEHFKRWQKGETGYPLVDAGLRELWSTGWMHNRVRMVVASFLVKDLLMPWQKGAEWFWDTLVDADLANNTLGWQWTAGCGADAAPYYRVFNPVLQGEKFDPHGEYVRRWIPELRSISDRFVHQPWKAPSPPRGYPDPVVDHEYARDQALAAFQQIKSRTS